MVSRAERQALERAELLRREAEELLVSASRRVVEVERQVQEDFAEQLNGLREELSGASRRATIAEQELDLLRAVHAELQAGIGPEGSSPEEVDRRTGREPSPGVPPSPPAGDAGAGGGEEARVMAAAQATAIRLHAQAELELARAREEAIRVLSSATSQAEELIAAAVAAIERDTALATATREQAERDGRVAAQQREEAEEALSKMVQLRRGLQSEIAVLRDALDRTRSSFDRFINASSGCPEAQPGDLNRPSADRRGAEPGPHLSPYPGAERRTDPGRPGRPQPADHRRAGA